MSRHQKRKKIFSDFVPGHIGLSFKQELSSLIDELAKDSPAGAYLKSEYLTKYSDPSTTPADVRRAAAIKKWLTTERRNAATNCRLMMADPDMVLMGRSWSKIREFIRKVVARVLGPLPYPAILWDSSFTGGASTRVNRSPTAMVDKLTGEAHCSQTALPHWTLASVETVLDEQKTVQQEMSVLFTVPKTTDIDRVACKEPEINMYLQRAVGLYIRRRLRTVGIDLTDQSRNQYLASVAQERHLATVDLSSASDSITRQLVIELLPFEWWSLMDDLRVKSTSIDGEFHHLEMFSSMGNGFTFELETLLFYAITCAVCWVSGKRGTISVYGDDIICPAAVVPRLGRFMSFLGFILNPKKTNFRGNLRESCGHHYINGRNVTPFYLRAPIAKVSDLIRVLNQLLIWDSDSIGALTTPSVYRFHKKWSRIIPASLHGGIDPREDSALVTGDAPRKRIMHRVKTHSVDEQARYYTWFLLRRLTDIPLDVTPVSMGRPFLASQPLWRRQTTWAPYLYRYDAPDWGPISN